MPDRFEGILAESSQSSPRAELMRKVFFGFVAVSVLVSLYVAFFGANTRDTKARATADKAVQNTYEACVAQNAARMLSNKELRLPIRKFASKQVVATNALVDFLNALPRDANQTEREKAAFVTFVNLYKQQAKAAELLKAVPLLKQENCDKLLRPTT